jgi:hypothetical protein
MLHHQIRPLLLWRRVHGSTISGWWFLMWFAHWADCLKPFPHTWHKNGNSPVWILLCLITSLLFVNPRSQMSQINGLSPVWDRLWTFKWLLWA